MSATKWKTRGYVRPYAPREWAIPHVGLCSQAAEAREEHESNVEDGWLREMEPDGGGHILGSLVRLGESNDALAR